LANKANESKVDSIDLINKSNEIYFKKDNTHFKLIDSNRNINTTQEKKYINDNYNNFNLISNEKKVNQNSENLSSFKFVYSISNNIMKDKLGEKNLNSSLISPNNSSENSFEESKIFNSKSLLDNSYSNNNKSKNNISYTIENYIKQNEEMNHEKEIKDNINNSNIYKTNKKESSLKNKKSGDKASCDHDKISKRRNSFVSEFSSEGYIDLPIKNDGKIDIIFEILNRNNIYEKIESSNDLISYSKSENIPIIITNDKNGDSIKIEKNLDYLNNEYLNSVSNLNENLKNNLIKKKRIKKDSLIPKNFLCYQYDEKYFYDKKNTYSTINVNNTHILTNTLLSFNTKNLSFQKILYNGTNKFYKSPDNLKYKAIKSNIDFNTNGYNSKISIDPSKNHSQELKYINYLEIENFNIKNTCNFF